MEYLLNTDYNIDLSYDQLSPEVTNMNKQLSIDFFNQMDDCGKTCYSDFLKL